VVDARFAKPLDAALLSSIAAEHELVVTIEENVLAGGFGSAVLELLAEGDLLRATRVLRLGLPDRYMTHGSPALLRQEAGLTPEQVARRIAEAARAGRDALEPA
jgi:1-deoxy-D-xylulose-5-phosphate synthase